VVFWPSAYDGGLPLQARALDHHYYVVSAVRKEHARIIDVLSPILAETGPYTDIAEAIIDLDKKVFSTDYNLDKLAALRLKYGRDVVVDMRCDEDMFSLASQRAGLSVADLMDEFGMETWSDYIAKSTAAQDARRHVAATTLGRSGLNCMSSEHFGRFAAQFKRVSGSSDLRFQAAIAC